MGALVAVIDKKGRAAAEKALDMLESLRHRFDYSYGIATENSVFIAKKEGKLTNEVPETPVAIGYGLSKIKPEDTPQPILEENFALTINGRFFPQQKPSDIEFARNLLKNNPIEKAEELLKKFDGSYSFAILHKDRIIVGRDPFGTSPLYYGENRRFAAVASEMRALRKLGIEKVKSFPPGTISTVTKDGLAFKKVRKVAKAFLKGIAEKEAIEILQKLLLESVKERIADLDQFGLAFSGGVDSGVLALLTKKCGAAPQLISVGLEGGKGIDEAVLAAEELGLSIKVKTFSEEEVAEAVPKVLWIIEEPNPIKLSIAIPLFFAAKAAKENGLKVILAGQGSDELFAGYKRYLQMFSEKGEKALHETLYNDFLNCYKTNFERDEKVCAFHNLELRLPFADWKLANYALKLPPKFKIRQEERPPRKVILRKAAEKLGLPASIAYKPKKAIQYTTGVASILKKIARRKGLSLQKYVEKAFNETYMKREEL